MKKLLSVLAVSTLVGTSASNLKPLFISNIINHGFKSNQLNNKDISIQNNNNFANKVISNGLIKKIVITDDDVMWVATDKGLYKSTDGTIFNNVFNQNITALININNTIYVGTNGASLYKSTDGINFQQVNGVPNDLYINDIAIAFDKSIYVGTEKGLWKSTDGINFQQIQTTGISKNSSIESLSITSNQVIYIGLNGKGLWKSTDGLNFQQIQTTGISKNSSIESLSITSISIAPNGTIYIIVIDGINHNLYKSIDGFDFNKIIDIPDGLNHQVININIDLKNTIYVGTNGTELYKSINGKKFNKIELDKEIHDEIISNFLIDKVKNIYIGTDKGLFKINNLIKINKPNYLGNLYNGIVYNSAQKIDIKDNLVASAILDTHSITVPTIDLDIPIGEHNLILTLKDKSLASVFGGDTSTGKVTYKLWVKTAIDKNKIDYQTKIDDTQLYTGLVSNAGNTNNADIIQTKIKNGTGTHDASLNIDFKDILIDFDVNKSFYAQGTIDETTNNFTATGSKQKINKNLSIKTDGIYHLHLEDTVGNTYDSYLELGESNWKLKGTFDDSELDKLKTKLNVTVNLTDPSQKSKAMGWLHQYENFVENKFNETIKTNGKGFDSEIKQQITSYTAFLNPLTYDIANEPKFDDGLDKNALVKTITDKAKELLKNGLDILPKHLNVNTSNVVNKSTLDSYSIWIKGYDTFINNNKDQWINDVVKVSSRGFATKEQEQQIKDQIRNLLDNSNIKNYLKSIIWEDNKLLKSTSNDYQKYIELDKLQTDTISWVNTNMSEINKAYQNAITEAESGLNLHGYSIDSILNGKSKPQTKSEIEKFDDGQSYHDWLQTQANMKFKLWQLAMGFGISIPLLLIVAAIGWVIRRKTDPRYNGIARARKETKIRKSNFKKSIKNKK